MNDKRAQGLKYDKPAMTDLIHANMKKEMKALLFGEYGWVVDG